MESKEDDLFIRY